MLIQKINSLSPILASKSPRRQYLLQEAGISFESIIQDVEEIYPSTMDIKAVPEYLAKLKIIEMAKQYPNRLIISADTVVVLNNAIFGKPKDEKDAEAMLQKLSGNMHEVISGVCFAYNNTFYSFSETTKVHFKALTNEDISFYVKTHKPLDKAGSYGIQEWIGYVGVEKIEGCFYNVMGLPVAKTISHIDKFMFP